MKPASLIATAFLGTISLAQCLRVVLGLDIQIGRALIPPWMSLAASLFCGVLAVGLYRETRKFG
ncbi:hypothetical protein [Geothrix oryzisoli]|uniref:hypothetical protein n=1 Tax=Geothrix oryzisoli TaxID=2922721 RepID=UPI001FAB610F|nr:hypothetical protein [Geothrix oryzisoli]